MNISTDSIRSTLAPYIEGLTAEHFNKVNIYMDLLVKWGSKMSLTSVHDTDQILRFHFGESLFVLKNLDIQKGRLADVGSGAGFPALALKIIKPELSITLLEPSKKKCAFLAEVSRELEFDSVEIVPTRFEEFRKSGDAFDFITNRALGRTDKLLKWSHGVLRLGGSVILWISSGTSETICEISGWNWKPNVILPNTRDRSILVGEKTG